MASLQTGRCSQKEVMLIACIQSEKISWEGKSFTCCLKGKSYGYLGSSGVIASAIHWLRGSMPSLQTEVSSRNVTDVCQVPGGNHALVSASDGTLSLLDVRQSGLRLSQVKLSPPLNCCQSDGVTAIAGGKGGQVSLLTKIWVNKH